MGYYTGSTVCLMMAPGDSYRYHKNCRQELIYHVNYNFLYGPAKISEYYIGNDY